MKVLQKHLKVNKYTPSVIKSIERGIINWNRVNQLKVLIESTFTHLSTGSLRWFQGWWEGKAWIKEWENLELMNHWCNTLSIVVYILQTLSQWITQLLIHLSVETLSLMKQYNYYVKFSNNLKRYKYSRKTILWCLRWGVWLMLSINLISNNYINTESFWREVKVWL